VKHKDTEEDCEVSMWTYIEGRMALTVDVATHETDPSWFTFQDHDQCEVATDRQSRLQNLVYGRYPTQRLRPMCSNCQRKFGVQQCEFLR
jgi:hypothetical protein